jgi:hypothetical protein
VNAIHSVLELIDTIREKDNNEGIIDIATTIICTDVYSSIKAEIPSRYQELFECFVFFLINDICFTGSASCLPARLYIDIISKAFFQQSKKYGASDHKEYRTGSFTVGKNGITNIPIIECTPQVSGSGQKSKGKSKKQNKALLPGIVKDTI